MCAIIPRQSIHDGKANGTVSRDLRSSNSRCSSTCINSLSSYPSLNVRKPVGIFNSTIHSFVKKGKVPLLASPSSPGWKNDMQFCAVENSFCIYSIEEFTRFYFIKLRLDTLSRP
jgi:hypothetical protein